MSTKYEVLKTTLKLDLIEKHHMSIYYLLF